MTLRDIKAMDTITVVDEQITEIINFYKPVANNYPLNIFIENGVIKQKVKNGYTTYLSFNMLREGFFKFGYYSICEYEFINIFNFTFDMSNGTNFDKAMKILDIEKRFNKSDCIEIIKLQLLLFFGTFYYIEKILLNQEITIKEIKTSNKIKKEYEKNDLNKINGKKIINIKSTKQKYLYMEISDDNLNSLKEYKKRIYNGSWTVSGHIRHYKSGKVGYIKPYVKGSGEFKKKEFKIDVH